MLSAIASVDVLTWISICIKALVYATSLTAAGTVLCSIFLHALPASEVAALKRFTVWLALAAAVLSLIRIPLRASFLTGGTWQGATDPMILGMVAQSPLGISVAVRMIGLALILTVLVPARRGRIAAGLGALLVAVSFALRGHALEEPRLLLGVLITLHLLGLAFWIGAFMPLYRVTGMDAKDDAGRLAHEFGRKAIYVVGSLTVAGGITLSLLTGNMLAAVSTPYGQFFLLKLGGFLAIITLAAWNKMQLTPALQRGDPAARCKLRRSIRWEATFILLVLLVTATLTTISAPIVL
ncbi:CopD family protein [Sulfitobacter sp. S223]|uniref:copper resistance D family protein n=1 Tax=Sulfitobacter sp. S223 TaxID=2867023 RepID=UPI0021A8B2A0|nr:CopD family protein [Sulfitobacter sp. S223]UWR25539.1 CopD family protein [Sulfitobacter sp. S223]